MKRIEEEGDGNEEKGRRKGEVRRGRDQGRERTDDEGDK